MKLPYSLPLLAPKVYVLRLMIKLEDDKTKYTLGIFEDQLLNFSYIVFSFTAD